MFSVLRGRDERAREWNRAPRPVSLPLHPYSGRKVYLPFCLVGLAGHDKKSRVLAGTPQVSPDSYLFILGCFLACSSNTIANHSQGTGHKKRHHTMNVPLGIEKFENIKCDKSFCTGRYNSFESQVRGGWTTLNAQFFQRPTKSAPPRKTFLLCCYHGSRKTYPLK